jgi:hypothetical protein
LISIRAASVREVGAGRFDPALAEACRSIHNCGRVPEGIWYEHHVVAGNYRLGELNAQTRWVLERSGAALGFQQTALGLGSIVAPLADRPPVTDGAAAVILTDVTTALGMKYGRTRYDIEAAGREHQMSSALLRPTPTFCHRGRPPSGGPQAVPP